MEPRARGAVHAWAQPTDDRHEHDDGAARALDGREGTLRKAHFVWLNRDQYAFEWFADLLRGIEEKDTRGLFDLRMWITSARADTAASTLGVALDLLAARTGRDRRTSTGTPPSPGICATICPNSARSCRSGSSATAAGPRW